MRFKEKMASRKFWMAYTMVLAATILLISPILSNLVFGSSIILITGAEYVSLCTCIYGIYVSGNIYDKKITKEITGNEEGKP